jgi:hypothetical protein
MQDPDGADQPLIPGFDLESGVRRRYFSSVRFLPSIITHLKIRLIRVW